jgi:antitoxin HicB
MAREMLLAYPATITRDEGGRFLVQFADLPEALTDGATEAEARAEAADCLSEALAGRITDGEPIPAPSPVGSDQFRVAPDQTVALKAALHEAMRRDGVSAAELARRLGVDHKEARRLLDPQHPTKLPRLTKALAVLGRAVTISVFEASKRERMLSSPLAPRSTALRTGKAARATETK